MVDISKIEVGKTYKYGELCEKFGEARVSSNSKKAQLKEWERFFKWTNITTQKYQIEEVYNFPKEKTDGRRNNGGNSTSKYLAMDDCIMNYLQKRRDVEVTIGTLLEDIGLLIKDYHCYKRKNEFFIDQGFSEGVVNNVFWKMQFIERNAKAAIDRLKKENYLNCEVDTILVNRDRSSVVLDDDGIQKEKALKQQIMTEMGIHNFDLYKKEKRKDFDPKYQAGLKELFGDEADYVFQRFHLILNDKKTYTSKSSSGRDGLTRRFVKEICMYIMSLDYKGFYLKENTQRQVINLLEQLFVHMNAENWNRYEEEDFKTNKELVFMVTYYQMQGGWRTNGTVTFEKTERKKDNSYRKGIKTRKVEERKDVEESIQK